MSGAFEEILGKKITGVCVRRNKRNPAGQVFLVFDDYTYFEMYSYEYIVGAKGVDKGNLDTVKNYSEQREGSEVFCGEVDKEG